MQDLVEFDLGSPYQVILTQFIMIHDYNTERERDKRVSESTELASTQHACSKHRDTAFQPLVLYHSFFFSSESFINPVKVKVSSYVGFRSLKIVLVRNLCCTIQVSKL